MTFQASSGRLLQSLSKEVAGVKLSSSPSKLAVDLIRGVEAQALQTSECQEQVMTEATSFDTGPLYSRATSGPFVSLEQRLPSPLVERPPLQDRQAVFEAANGADQERDDGAGRHNEGELSDVLLLSS